MYGDMSCSSKHTTVDTTSIRLFISEVRPFTIQNIRGSGMQLGFGSCGAYLRDGEHQVGHALQGLTTVQPPAHTSNQPATRQANKPYSQAL